LVKSAQSRRKSRRGDRDFSLLFIQQKAIISPDNQEFGVGGSERTLRFPTSGSEPQTQTQNALMVHIKIGSAPSNNIVLNHPSVSPFHLEIVQDDKGNFLLTDLNSLYGTTVNGYRIQGMVQLRPTDIVKAGELVLPWNNYFLYQAPPVTPVVNPSNSYQTPAGETTQNPYINPVAAPVIPEKPKNKKKIFMFVGGGVLALLLVIAAAIYLYTRPSFKHLKLIPSDAFVITSVNLKNIAGKIDMDKVQKLDFFKDMKKQSRGDNDAISKAMSDPMSSGIDIFSQPYAFVTAEHDDYTRYTGGVVFAIKSEKDFRIFMSRATDGESIKQTDKYSIIRMGGGACVAWDGDAGVFLFSDKSRTRTENYCRSLFEQSEKESILSVESFKKFREAQYDIGFYLNYDALRGIPGVKVPAYMDGSATMATINFNDGKLSYASEYLPSATAAANPQSILGKKGINDALKATIPGKSYGILSLSLDLNELYKVMKKDPNMNEALDEISRGMQVSSQQLPLILTGEFYASLADVKPMGIPRMRYEYDYETNDYKYEETIDTMLMPSYIFGVTAKDKTTLESIINRMEGKDTTGGIRYWHTYRQGNYYIANNGMNYFMTNDYSLATSLSQGKAAVAVSGPMAQLISNDPMYSYFNLNLSKYPAALPDYLEGSMGRRDYNDFETFINIFDYVELIGDGTKQTMDVYLVEKGNCLNTFLQTGNDIYLNHRR
jgi:hypothetical protein